MSADGDGRRSLDGLLERSEALVPEGEAPLTAMMIQSMLAGRLIEELIRQVLASEAMDSTVFTVLTALWFSEPDRRVTAAELQALVVVTQSGVSRAIQRAERDGLVRKVPVPGDRRTFHVELTAAGRRRAGGLVTRLTAAFSERLGPIGPDEVMAIARSAETMSVALHPRNAPDA